MSHRNPFSVGATLGPLLALGTRVQHTSIIAPFLYQTSTITRGYRGAANRLPPIRSLATPFEDTSSKSQSAGSTITDTELEAFAKLFNLAVSEAGRPTTIKSKQKKGTLHRQSKSEVTPQEQPETTVPYKPIDIDISRFPAGLRELAASAKARIQQKEESTAIRLVRIWEQREAEDELTINDPLKPERDKQAESIETEIKAAKTDVELWNVLEKHVFAAIAALRLDETQISSVEHLSKQEEAEEKKRAEALAIIGPIYPTLVLTAVQELRSYFPSSTLPLMLLQRIKDLGRASYALGASTALYNELINMLAESSNYRAILELLLEMENGGINFDRQTWMELKYIVQWRDQAYHGKLEGVVEQVLATESMANDLRQIEQWRSAVYARLRQVDERVALLQAAGLEQLENDVHEN